LRLGSVATTKRISKPRIYPPLPNKTRLSLFMKKGKAQKQKATKHTFSNQLGSENHLGKNCLRRKIIKGNVFCLLSFFSIFNSHLFYAILLKIAPCLFRGKIGAEGFFWLIVFALFCRLDEWFVLDAKPTFGTRKTLYFER
jgi:hypothetical protein